MYTKFCYFGLLIMLTSCTDVVRIENEKKGKLTPQYQLVVGDEKKIPIDHETAVKPPYMQLINGASKSPILTFLNPHKNAIYFYDYATTTYLGRIIYEREGPNAIFRVGGYFIKNMDSIYVYNELLTELVLADSFGLVKHRVSLRGGGRPDWSRYYPQYIFSGVSPLIENHEKLMMVGMSPFSIADSLILKFQFTSVVDLKSNNVEFFHTYPKKMYGFNANWQDPMFMQPYPELSPTGELIYSFPVSHDLYIAQAGTEGYKVVYAGSNEARTINSIGDKKKKTPNDVIHAHIVQQDLYTAIRHDPYRNVYYRVMLRGIPDAAFSTPALEKAVVVIIMDEQFNYLGETTIVSWEKWNWMNAFVTSEGLVMEYVDHEENFDEEHLILKTLVVEKL